MWFASIWIFTLGLPWRIGADFFYRHLLDGDAASNTLSWRWVAGLHTRGKAYAAESWNIEKFTGGRFNTAIYEMRSDIESLDHN
jgi:deoxyribodipyrimidine photo-lyase